MPVRQVAGPPRLLLPTRTPNCYHLLTGGTGAGMADIWTRVPTLHPLATDSPAQDNETVQHMPRHDSTVGGYSPILGTGKLASQRGS
jgi:hypothetical protein